MNALIFSTNGVRRGTIGSANTTFGENSVNTLNVTVDGKVETFVPSSVYSAESILGSDVKPNLPFALVAKRDYRTVARLAPHIRKVRGPRKAKATK